MHNQINVIHFFWEGIFHFSYNLQIQIQKNNHKHPYNHLPEVIPMHTLNLSKDLQGHATGTTFVFLKGIKLNLGVSWERDQEKRKPIP